MNGSPLTMLSNIFTRSPVPSSSNPVPSSSSSPVWIVTLLASQTLQLRMAPYCYICSYRQPTGPQRRVNHRHSSSREVRLMQGVDFSTQALTYMCPTCMEAHDTWPEYGLNVCLGTSHLHNVHHPMDPTVTCPPDPLHVDWVTISGGTITDLTNAFLHDYKRQCRPMRILVSAGLNDIIRGADRDTVVGRFIRLKEVIDEQNLFHAHASNQLTIAALLNPPKLVWFEGNGPAPDDHVNHLGDIKEINAWISNQNSNNGRTYTPRFNRFGVRCGRVWDEGAGSMVKYQQHQMNQWRESEPVHDKLHLNDQWRVRMAGAVVKHFQGELNRFGPLV